MRRGAVTAFGAPLGDVQLRLVGDVAQRAGFGAAAEQGSLRALQHLDALHVDHVDVKVAARKAQRRLIEVKVATFGNGAIDAAEDCSPLDTGGEAAHVDIALARAVGAEAQRSATV